MKKFLLLFILLPTIAQAQIAANLPFTILFNHDCLITTGYKLFIDGLQVSDTPFSGSVCSAGNGTLPYTGVAAGNHIAAVSAYNDMGESSKASVSFTAYTSPVAPSISFISPATNSNPPTNGRVAFSVSAIDVNGIVSVQFFVNGVLFSKDVTAPYLASYNFKKKPKGTYIILALATNKAGLSSTTSINIIKP